VRQRVPPGTAVLTVISTPQYWGNCDVLTQERQIHLLQTTSSWASSPSKTFNYLCQTKNEIRLFRPTFQVSKSRKFLFFSCGIVVVLGSSRQYSTTAQNLWRGLRIKKLKFTHTPSKKIMNDKLNHIEILYILYQPLLLYILLRVRSAFCMCSLLGSPQENNMKRISLGISQPFIKFWTRTTNLYVTLSSFSIIIIISSSSSSSSSSSCCCCCCRRRSNIIAINSTALNINIEYIDVFFPCGAALQTTESLTKSCLWLPCQDVIDEAGDIMIDLL
jgi:hypothetical protein